jgi:hypothetical protein
MAGLHLQYCTVYRAQISGRQTPGLTRGSPPLLTNAGVEPRVKPGVWRPEMWAQYTLFTKTCTVHVLL